MPIRVLDAETVGRIAAGEVVERPASIAKELIENSLDAGASAITVEIRDGGCAYLRVTDNGCGIPAEEARIAFENHATSKITSGDELNDLMTLGFRGEALPSIAAVSKVVMTTRVRNAESGVRVRVEGGAIQEVSAAGCPEGTSIVVQDLFFNTPVRQTFLKKPATEAGVLADMVSRLILGNPGVSIRLINNGKTVYHSFGDGDVRHAALAVYGRETAERLVPMDESEGAFRVSGLIGVGDLEKANRTHQFFFINGRVVRSSLMTQALEAATRTMVTIGQHPMCALSLRLPPNAVDVNVHPSKLEVRFRDEAGVRTYVESMLSRALLRDQKMLDPQRLSAQEEPVYQRPAIRVEPSVQPRKKPEEIVLPKNEVLREKVEAIMAARRETEEKAPPPVMVSMADSGAVLREAVPATPRPVMPHVSEEALWSAPPKEKAEEPIAVQEQMPLPEAQAEIRLLGVFASTYILVEYNDTLIMIDQHAAHERIRYQEYEKALHQGTAMQQLLTPIVLTLSPRETSVLMASRELLLEAGYEIESFGERDIQVRAVPQVLGQADMRPLFLEMIDRLDQLKNATIERRRSEVIQTSCKRAVKAGDRLTEAEISALVDEMIATSAPPTCPHGRPVLRAFRKGEIEHMFKRA